MDNTGKKKLLLVEDQMIIAFAQATMLETNSYSVVHAHTGENAVNIIMNDLSIDLILMDIDLGKGMSGPEAAKTILSIRTLPIVFLTAHSESDIVDKVKSITRYGFVIKDSGAFVLLSSIEMAFELFDAHQNIENKIKELNEKEKTFAKIFHTNSVIMSVSNVDDGIFIEVNETFLNRLGYSRDEIIGKSIELVADIEDVKRADTLVKEHGSLHHFEAKVYTKTGKTVHGLCSVDFIEMNGRRCMLSTMIDITENKLAREAVQKSEAHYHLLADHMSDAVWLMDVNLNTTYCSPSVARLRGYTIDEIMQIPLNKHLTPDSLNKALNVYLDERKKFMADSNYSFVFSMETEYYKKDGTTVLADSTFTLIRDKDGNPESIMGEARDITDRKVAENKIRKLLIEKELLLKEVHHRIKNNMSTIASLLYLQGNSIEDQSAANALNEAYNRVQSMMIVYDKLYRSSDFREISCKEYLSDLITSIESAINTSSSIEITSMIDDCLMDTATLFPVGIIINELLANAFKYAFKGKTGGTISISLIKTGENIEINFKDDGIGVPDLITSGESTGFGINLVKILVQQLSGSVEILRDNGTEFIIRFSF